MPQKIKHLSPLSLAQHQHSLKRLRHCMDQYNLTQAEVAKLLGYSRTTITYWFQNKVRCPDNVTDLLRVILETVSPEYLERLKNRG